MNSEQIFEQFNQVPDTYRMLCIDAAAVACYLRKQGHEAAGMKLLHIAITTAELDTELFQQLLTDPEKSFDALAMHAEIRSLVKKISG